MRWWDELSHRGARRASTDRIANTALSVNTASSPEARGEHICTHEVSDYLLSVVQKSQLQNKNKNSPTALMERAAVATIERQTTAPASKVAHTNLKTAELEGVGGPCACVCTSLSLSVSLAVAAAQPAQGIIMWMGINDKKASQPTSRTS